MRLKSSVIIVVVFLFFSKIVAQENIFLSRNYWKKNPSVEQVKSEVLSGNDPTELNRYAFDAVVYALLEETNDDTIKYLLSLEGNEVEKRTHDSRTYIFWAAYKGDVHIMQHLFDKGAVINIKDSHGNTPVTFAAFTGQKDIAVYELFEKKGATLYNERNDEGVSSLFLVAPYLETEQELSYFLNKGFSLNDKDPIGNNIFNYAARKGNIAFLKMLIEKGVDPKVMNSKGGNAILYASQGVRNHQNTIETYQFLESLGISANVIGDKRRNPLHSIASNTNDLELLSYFIKNDVTINLTDDTGNTPFMNAARNNDVKVVEFLSEHVKDVNVKDKKGQSALTKAVTRNTIEVVDFLLKKGGDVQVKDTDKNTLAYYLLNVFKENDTKAFEQKLQLLQEQGLSMDQLQNNGNTLLHIATQKNNLALLKRLISFEIDVNVKNNEGYTALHLAAMKAHNDEILKYLLSIGGDKTIKTEYAETVLDLASENELLLKQNVQLNFLQ